MRKMGRWIKSYLQLGIRKRWNIFVGSLMIETLMGAQSSLQAPANSNNVVRIVRTPIKEQIINYGQPLKTLEDLGLPPGHTNRSSPNLKPSTTNIGLPRPSSKTSSLSKPFLQEMTQQSGAYGLKKTNAPLMSPTARLTNKTAVPSPQFQSKAPSASEMIKSNSISGPLVGQKKITNTVAKTPTPQSVAAQSIKRSAGINQTNAPSGAHPKVTVEVLPPGVKPSGVWNLLQTEGTQPEKTSPKEKGPQASTGGIQRP